jgi:hypothetical protein
MAGRLVVNTLNTDTVGAVLTTQNGMTGIAKAWARWAGASGTISDSYNVSSVTRNATADYSVNFTTAMANANYAFAGSCGGFATNEGSRCVNSSSSASPTTAVLRLVINRFDGVAADPTLVAVAVFSS